MVTPEEKKLLGAKGFKGKEGGGGGAGMGIFQKYTIKKGTTKD